jgi:septum formation protein
MQPSPAGPAAALALVLGSGSPRRRELLARARVPFEVLPADIEESRRPGETPGALAERLAREKALEVARRLGEEPARLVLGADTIVVIDDEVLGKPADAEDAVRLLRRLTGRTHRVLTGVAVVATADLSVRSLVVTSRVAMRSATEAEIRRYVAGGEPLDKAGAYAAQGDGRKLIAGIEGSETNVIGLPIDETLALLHEAGLGGLDGRL